MGFEANEKHADYETGNSGNAKKADVLLEHRDPNNDGTDRSDTCPDWVCDP